MATVENRSKARTASRETRRKQLIEATFKCIARKGMGSTTLADVAGEAGLSQGIVNLHFRSKDNLLNEALKCLSDEYRTQFDRTCARAGPGPADKLLALMEMDFRPSICDRKKLAVWFAFWGEVKSMPAYQRICDNADRHYDAIVERLCRELIEEGGYQGLSAAAVSDALAAMTNGLWLSYLISPKTWDRRAAMDAVMTYLRGVFPKHFH